MENVIRIRFDKEINKGAFILAKNSIKDYVCLEESDIFDKIDNGVSFVFDEDMDDGVEMTNGEDGRSAFIQISSDSAYTTAQIYEMVENIINRVEV